MRHELAGVGGYRPGPLVLDMGPGRQQSLQEDMVVGGLVVVGQPAKRKGDVLSASMSVPIQVSEEYQRGSRT